MHHTAAFTASIGNVANTQVNALLDQILTIQNNNFLLPQDMSLLWIYAQSATLQRARYTSPSLRQITQPQIRPLNVGATPVQDPNVMVFKSIKPIIKALEEFQAQVTSGVAMTEQAWIIFSLLDRFVPVVQGDMVTLRGTSTTAAVANTWSQITYALDDQLPNGVYAMIGSEVQSTNAIAHRWTFDNQFYRPGGLSITALGNRSFAQQYLGDLGEWGRFRNTSLPRLEVLANAADAAHVILPSVIKVG